MKSIAVLPLLLALPFAGAQPMLEFVGSTATKPKNIEFDNQRELNNWIIVNDTVMGGRSNANLVMADKGLVFQGRLSLENNGGFASIRRIKNNGQWRSDKPLQLRVVGDGRVYQFRIRTDKTFDGIAYSAAFSTEAGVSTLHSFSELDFTPQWRGRRVLGAPPLRFSDITQLGILLGDKRTGAFELTIEEVTQ